MDDCPIGILVDLSEPTSASLTLSPLSLEEEEEDKENAIPLTDSIEIERSADAERRLSLTLKSSGDIQSRILCDVTEQTLQSSAKKCASPGLRLIDDEIFDFDIAVSPGIRAEEVSKEDDDEVFFGPVCFTEQLKRTAIQDEEIPPLSPLNAEQFANMVKEANYVAYRIKNSKTSSGEDSSPTVKPKNSSSADEQTTPYTRRHNRSGTFTKCQSPLELLPEDVRKILPVIDDSKKKLPCDNKESNVNGANYSDKLNQELVNKRIENNRLNNKTTGTRLKPPSKLQASKLVQPSLKYGSSCESLEGKDSRSCDGESDTKCSVTSDCSDVQPQPSNIKQTKMQNVGKTGIAKKSKLVMPGNHLNRSSNSSLNCSLNTSTTESKKTSVKTSRLLGPKTGIKTAINASTPNRAPPKINGSTVTKNTERRKSGESTRRSSPRLKAKQGNDVKKTGVPGLKGPITKLSLMKPGDLQKRLHKPSTATEKGPLKAVKPMENLNVSVNKKNDTKVQTSRPCSTTCISTPVKQDKRVKPTLLANNFTTPHASGSSSTSTPMSSRRKSFLPTPQKSGSFSSIPGSPLTRRGLSSSSSRRSQVSSCSSISDSPVFNNSINRPTIGSARKSVARISSLSEAIDNSPSSIKIDGNIKNRLVDLG